MIRSRVYNVKCLKFLLLKFYENFKIICQTLYDLLEISLKCPFIIDFYIFFRWAENTKAFYLFKTFDNSSWKLLWNSYFFFHCEE